jgi:ABC-2 type transport system permease protein
VTVDRLLATADRELTTVVRTRAFLALALGFAVVVVGLAWTGGPAGYLPAVLALLTPVEVLVPALALAFGYRAISGDATRGELDVVRTFPVARSTYVVGVYLGRAAALLVAVLSPLLAVVPLVALAGGTKTDVIASFAGADSFVLYVRFVVLVAGFALVVLAVALAVSTIARSGRSALVAAVTVALLLVVGLDLAVVTGLGVGIVGDAGLGYLLALSPNSAFRGLVLDTVVGAAAPTGPAARPVAAVLGLLAWLVAALALAAVTVWSPARRD